MRHCFLQYYCISESAVGQFLVSLPTPVCVFEAGEHLPLRGQNAAAAAPVLSATRPLGPRQPEDSTCTGAINAADRLVKKEACDYFHQPKHAHDT
jgi:hypothetical protein